MYHSRSQKLCGTPVQSILRLKQQLKDVLWLATVGGAEALGLQARLGLLKVGMAFDALAVDPRRCGGGGARGALHVDVGEREEDTFEETVEKYLHNGDDRQLLGVWVQGRLVVDNGLAVRSKV